VLGSEIGVMSRVGSGKVRLVPDVFRNRLVNYLAAGAQALFVRRVLFRRGGSECVFVGRGGGPG
jgi:hypothetical protein